MAIKVKDIASSAQKWGSNTGRASDEYAQRAQAAANDWANNTAAASDNFHAAVTAAGVKERFRRGVQAAGAAKFARKVADVGRDRFAPGVAAAIADWQARFAPYAQTLAGVTLSPRKPKGDSANYRRVEEVGKALTAKRLAMLGPSSI